MAEVAGALLLAAGYTPIRDEVPESAPTFTLTVEGKLTLRRLEFDGNGELGTTIGAGLTGTAIWKSGTGEAARSEPFQGISGGRIHADEGIEAEENLIATSFVGAFTHSDLAARLAALLFPAPADQVAYFMRLLESDDGRFHSPAVLSLDKLDADLSPALPALLAHFPASWQIDTTAGLLVRIGGEKVVTFFFDSLDSSSSDHRDAAIRALGNFPEPRVVRALSEAYFKADHRDPLSQALAKIGPPAAPVVLSALEVDERREAAATLLGKLGHPDAVAPLVALLSHDEMSLRGAAAGALGDLPGPPRPMLRKLPASCFPATSRSR